MIHNVKDYGAKSDWATDDTDAIRRAIAAACAGDVVHLPLGTYVTREDLHLPPDADVAGEE